ncbi:hypothetical protein ACOIFA_30885, partial [Klebsiella pneumoniae]|uniref:hypothetical protein n=1 Tax=Klebsiella pneumoniae TaxID=573 RepID=UPI003B58DB12
MKSSIAQAGFKEIFHGLPAELRALKRPLIGGLLFFGFGDLHFWPAIAVRQASGVAGHTVKRWRVIPAHKFIFHSSVRWPGTSPL